MLRPADVLPVLTETSESQIAFYLSGDQTYWSDNELPDTLDLTGFQKNLLSLITLRLVDKGLLSLDQSVSDVLPSVISGGPFTAPLTFRHLLQETAGFASPPLNLEVHTIPAALAGKKLKRFAISMRSAGQISVHDPVGWAVLVAALENATSRSVQELLEDEVLLPLGLRSDSISLSYRLLGGGNLSLTVRGSPTAFVEASRIYIRNRDAANQPYLKRSTHLDLTTGQFGYRMHPDSESISSGVTVWQSNSHRWITSLNDACRTGAAFVAFPREGAVFGMLREDQTCMGPKLERASMTIANDQFPGSARAATDGPPLAKPSKLEGRYVPAMRSPYGLQERLDILGSDWLFIFGYTGDQLRVRRNGGPLALYRQPSAYIFENETDAADRLVFSPFRLGGYVVADNKLFRRADILGAAGQLRAMMPWALLTILTAGYYALGNRSRPWRRMGQFAILGGVLVGGGLYLEANHWANVLYEIGQPWMITLWRSAINIGLMLVLSVPMFVLSFAKKKTIPTSGLAILTAPHLTFVAISALTVFFTLVLWGVAGTFRPY